MELVELVVLMGEVTMACRLHRQRGVRWSGLMSGTFLELCSAISRFDDVPLFRTRTRRGLCRELVNQAVPVVDACL